MNHGKVQNAWAILRLATSRQRELTEGYAAIGVNFMHLDKKFHNHLLKEAVKTDTDTVVARYRPLLQSIMFFEGSVVTPEFNRRLASRFALLLERTD
jgi:hypothetical protein